MKLHFGIEPSSSLRRRRYLLKVVSAFLALALLSALLSFIDGIINPSDDPRLCVYYIYWCGILSSIILSFFVLFTGESLGTLKTIDELKLAGLRGNQIIFAFNWLAVDLIVLWVVYNAIVLASAAYGLLPYPPSSDDLLWTLILIYFSFVVSSALVLSSLFDLALRALGCSLITRILVLIAVNTHPLIIGGALIKWYPFVGADPSRIILASPEIIILPPTWVMVVPLLLELPVQVAKVVIFKKIWDLAAKSLD